MTEHDENNSLVSIAFAELHNALFLGGKNFGLRLDPYKFKDLKMEYDLKEKELRVTWLASNKTAHIPHSNVAYYIPGPPFDRKIDQIAPPQVAHIGSAQVETPMSHVHAGEGHGKTGLGGRVK